jgi:hypothetical protein
MEDFGALRADPTGDGNSLQEVVLTHRGKRSSSLTLPNPFSIFPLRSVEKVRI